MENNSLEKDALVTLLYNDVFDMPLTAFEVWRYRIFSGRLGDGFEEEGSPAALFDVEEALATLFRKGLVEKRCGMYALAGRGHLVRDRIRRMKRSDGKWRRLLRVVRLMRACPFVRMIAVTGRLASGQTEAKSDWDVLVVMERGHIWTGRLFLTLFLHAIGKRRWGRHTKDRVCLNHFLTTASLGISPKDLFAAREYARAIPVFGWETFQAFERENAWIRSYLPDWEPQIAPPLRLLPESSFSRRVQRALERVLDFSSLERLARNGQRKKIERNPKTLSPEAHIVADDSALVFLPHPQGPRVFEKFMQRMEELK